MKNILCPSRYIVLAYPLRSWLYLNPLYIKLCTAAIWIISIVLALLPVMFWRSKKEYEMFMSDAIGLSTLILMFALYLRIYILMHRCHERNLGPTNEESTSSTQGNVTCPVACGTESCVNNCLKNCI